MIESTMAFRFRAGAGARAGLFSTAAVSSNYYSSTLAPFFYLFLVWLLRNLRKEKENKFIYHNGN